LKRKLIIINIIFLSLAEELLAKESIGLPDIIRILGDRPFPMKETVREYLQEMLDRKEKEDNVAVPNVEATTAEESDKKEEKEEKPSETTTKDNEKKE
jgi:hypothetical protein